MDEKMDIIDEIVKRTDATYKEAKEAYEKSDEDLLNAIIYLEEKKGKKTHSDDDVLEELKKLVKEVNASKIIVKKDEETIINLPITAGAIGLVLAPLLSIGGLTVAMLSKYEVIIIAKDGTKYNLNKKFEDSIKKYSDS
ncbi:MAG TPA: ubiquitin [Clostridiales bacterium]|jgi:NACalpha-BTF3-like transcription factor|nr:ubiquitin [Clostridiales bacterium]